MTQSSSSVNPSRVGWWIYLSFCFLWICGLSLLIQYGTWTAEQTFLMLGKEFPQPARIIPSVIQLVLISAVLLPGLRGDRTNPYRGIILAWIFCDLFAFLSLPVRFLSPNLAQTANLYQIGACIVFFGTAALWKVFQKSEKTPVRIIPGGKMLIATLIAPVCIWSWVLWGSPGSPIDIFLNLLAGIGFGQCAAWIVSTFLLNQNNRPLTGMISRRSLLVQALAGGAGFLMMASIFGYNGLQTILMFILLGCGLLVIPFIPFNQTDAIDNEGRRPFYSKSYGILVGLICAAPMIMLDPDELALILNLGTRDTLFWSNLATAASLVCILLCGLLGLAFVGGNHPKRLQRKVLVPLVIIAWLVLVGMLWQGGRLGFHGEHIFVILTEQADLRPADAIQDPLEKRRWVQTHLIETADRTQKDIRKDLTRQGIHWKPYYLVNALEVEMDILQGRWLLGDRKEVSQVFEIPVLRPLPAPYETVRGKEDKPQKELWNLRMIGADKVWREFGVRGEGIVIGQSDTGVEWSHPELKESYRGWDAQKGVVNHNGNWFDTWNNEPEPIDRTGHGTHTLGTMVGKTVGVAPGATWYACDNLARNLGNPARYLDCMQFMLAPQPLNGDAFRDGVPESGAHVINNSWGCPESEGCRADTLAFAASALKAAGIFVVVSAGNDGMDCSTLKDPLAIYPDVFTVGAVNRSGKVVGFSSRGPVLVDGSRRIKPDGVAPGAGILSSYPGGMYEFADGTSMAGPHVAGIVALVWSANPKLIGHVDATRKILIETADPYADVLNLPCTTGEKTPSNEAGYGIINAYEAVKRARAWKEENQP